MRFLIELIIKLCYVEQQMPGSTIDEKIEQHKKIFGSSTISEKSSLDLYMLSEKSGNQIREDLGRQYGISSNYAHLSTRQIRERIARSNNDVVAEQDNIDERVAVVNDIRYCYAMILAVIFHSVPNHVTGNWLVGRNGASNEWYFGRSRFIAEIDAYFDYKAERQSSLDEIQRTRGSRGEF
jgi:hypothetical protein